MPIVKTLGNPCLKDRHWEKISEIVGFPLRADDDLTLAKILDYGLEEYVLKFQTISDSATKESNLEMKLNQMIAEWTDIKFEIAPYRLVIISVVTRGHLIVMGTLAKDNVLIKKLFIFLLLLTAIYFEHPLTV